MNATTLPPLPAMPAMPAPARFLLIDGVVPLRPMARDLSQDHAPSCAQYTSDQMIVFAAEHGQACFEAGQASCAIEADRANRAMAAARSDGLVPIGEAFAEHLAQKNSEAAVAQSQAAPQALIRALRFYGHENHIAVEHENYRAVDEWLEHDSSGDRVENGALARQVLCGEPVDWDDVPGNEPIAGEAAFARVPMTGEQCKKISRAWSRGGHTTFHTLIRAVELHHGITSSTGSAT